ncbi:MAG: hypothetical protein WBV21_04125 [Desulfobacterales bacterium]
MRDEDETVGNTVKMTMWNLIDEERNCEKVKFPAPGAKPSKTEDEPPNWDHLIPR